jgi:integrase
MTLILHGLRASIRPGAIQPFVPPWRTRPARSSWRRTSPSSCASLGQRRRSGKPLTVEEVRTFLQASRDDRLHALYVVLALLGLRRSEALGLRWDDVDLEQGLLMVRHGLQRIDGRLQLLPPKTRRSRRTVPLPTFLLEALVAHRERQDRERRDLATDWPDLGFVFTTPVGTPVHPRNCTRVVQKALKAAGVRTVRLHDFRHGCVSVLLAAGVPPRTTMEIAGHTTVEMTMNVYGHVTLDDKRAALASVGNLFETKDDEQVCALARIHR